MPAPSAAAAAALGPGHAGRARPRHGRQWRRRQKGRAWAAGRGEGGRPAPRSLQGPVGMAAAAAVATGKKRKRPHIFESNPSIRKRQQTRLLRKLRATLDEYTTRVGQQAIVLCISPSKPNPVFKVFGAAPLENVVRKYKSMILEDLESALLEHAPAPQEVNSELPPLTIDGIPVSVDKMTQPEVAASKRVGSHTAQAGHAQGALPAGAEIQGGPLENAALSFPKIPSPLLHLSGPVITWAEDAFSPVGSFALPELLPVSCSEAAAHAVATLAEATLQGGGQIVLSGETAAAVGALTGVQDANVLSQMPWKAWKGGQIEVAPAATPLHGLVQIPVSMYQTVVTSLAQGNGPVQVAMAPVAARITDSTVTMDGQAVEVVTLEQ
ncbi:nuclear respiratory factor 1 [Sphaerodactylus townsendi]|uniref:nuclear respiratory factor 1 n=1 Tax=Sphaerodactylus townsendi TaxID=933632 RepID=UPI002026864C|nr:nuclear respiratory factor 1 [Sphaerodactylus townsendi]